MKLATICFCLKGDKVLLAMKKRGFGVGKWNGYGGKVKADESIKAGAARELEEESGLRAQESDLQQVGLITFYFDNVSAFECAIFIIKAWTGEPIETEEMRPKWFAKDALPFSEMWPGDKIYIPIILNDEKIKGECYFNKAGDVVEKFSWDKAEFD